VKGYFKLPSGKTDMPQVFTNMAMLNRKYPDTQHQMTTLSAAKSAEHAPLSKT